MATRPRHEKRPDPDSMLGRRASRDREFWAFAVSIGACTLGAGLAVATGVHQLGQPEPPTWAYGVVAVGALLAAIAIGLVVRLKALLIGETATRKDVEAMRAAIEVEPDVVRIVHLTATQVGPDELLVGAKVEFQHELTVAEVAATIDRIERTIRSGVPAAQTIYLEPDVALEHRATGFVEEHTGRSDPIAGADDDIWTDSTNS
jgi:divalent metal cation (Fe/Co/Zn/Cd) transporter